MNEYQPYDYVLHQAAMQPSHTYATVWDSTFESDIERFATHGCSRLFPHENGTQSVFPIETIIGMNAGLEAEGYIVRADSIEELAEKLNLPVETFVKTVERYNELAVKGEDEVFGKEAYRLSTMDAPPYFGTRQCGGYFICTMDGNHGRHPDRRQHARRSRRRHRHRGPLCRGRLLRQLFRKQLSQPDGRSRRRPEHHLWPRRGQERCKRDLMISKA